MRWRIGRSLSPLQKFSLVTFLSVLVVTTVACGIGGWLLVRHLVAHDAALAGDLARLLLTRSLPVSLFVTTEVDPSRYARTMNDIAASDDVVRVLLYDHQGRVLWSDDDALIGRRFGRNRDLRAALGGEIEAKIIRPGKEEHEGLRSFARLEEIYLPIRYAKDGPVVGVLEIYRYPPAFFAVVDRALALVWLVGGGGGFIIYATLFMVARLGVLEVGPSAAPALSIERIAERARSEAALRRMNETLEEETKRLAHEVHDEAAQLIATAQLALADVAHEMPLSGRDGVEKVSRVLDEVADHLRRLAHELRPTILDDLGLVPALEFLARGVTKRTALNVRVEGCADGRLSPIVETTLYRVVQEAVSNVIKHAHARGMIIRVDREPEYVRCSIRDDGAGFDAVAVAHPKGPRGLGLLGIGNRVEALGGTFEIRTKPGQGTMLIIGIPVS